MNVIETRELCKSYGSHQVLHSIDMQIGEGQLVGFLGPNGAGKTTTIRILMGLLAKSSGSARMFGRALPENGKKVRADVGYLPGDVYLYSNLTGEQLIRFYCKARKKGKGCLEEGFRLADTFGLPLNKNIRKFSTGMRQKMGLVQALMHCPRLLLLDEPTSSLDPLIRVEVFAELRRATRDGRTVLFSSHSLDEVESLCDEVIILRDGRIVEQQQIETLKDRALRKVHVTFNDGFACQNLPTGFKVFESNESQLTGTWSGDVELLLSWLQTQSIIDVIIERPDLNDLFMSYYADKASEVGN